MVGGAIIGLYFMLAGRMVGRYNVLLLYSLRGIAVFSARKYREPDLSLIAPDESKTEAVSRAEQFRPLPVHREHRHRYSNKITGYTEGTEAGKTERHF